MAPEPGPWVHSGHAVALQKVSWQEDDSPCAEACVHAGQDWVWPCQRSTHNQNSYYLWCCIIDFRFPSEFLCFIRYLMYVLKISTIPYFMLFILFSCKKNVPSSFFSYCCVILSLKWNWTEFYLIDYLMAEIFVNSISPFLGSPRSLVCTRAWTRVPPGTCESYFWHSRICWSGCEEQPQRPGKT